MALRMLSLSRVLARSTSYSALLRASTQPALGTQWRRLCTSPVEVPIPELGAESIVEGGILSLAKGVGDFVAAEEMVAEIETDKVTIEAKSPHAGTIKAIHVEVGQTVEVGKPFFALAVGVGEARVASNAAPSAGSAAAEPVAAAAAAPVNAMSEGRVHPSGRASLIRFPARGASAAILEATRRAAATAAPKKPPPMPVPVGTIAHAELPLRFRRKDISPEEMEAVMTGGADYTW